MKAIEELASESGFLVHFDSISADDDFGEHVVHITERITRFAALVLEEAAQVCESEARQMRASPDWTAHGATGPNAANLCAAVIRAIARAPKEGAA